MVLLILEQDKKLNVTSKQNMKRRRVTFSIEAPNAEEITLTDNFNDWNAKRHPMKNMGKQHVELSNYTAAEKI